MKISDFILIVLIVFGISMTVMNLLAARKPIASVQSFTLHEIAPNVAGESI